MNYIITEQQNERIVKSIIKYLDSNLTPYSGWDSTKNYKREIGYSGGELFLSLAEDEVSGDDIHMWYSECDNENLDNPIPEGHCPVVKIDSPYGISLDGYFGDLWKPVFKKWFQHHTGLPIVQVDVY